MNTSNKKPIGILGGTFDPIHLGHLQIAGEIHHRVKMQQVRFIPSDIPVHRPLPSANTKDRLAMVKLAISDTKDFILDDREIRRGGPSYMIDTLMSIRKEINNTSLCLLMASDVLAEFHHWHRWKEIMSYAHLVVVMRPGYQQPTHPELLKFLHQHQITDSSLIEKYPAGKILFLEFPLLPISSTEIRQLLAEGKNVEPLLPKKVWEYIREHSLYKHKNII